MFTLPPLPYGYDALSPVVSEETLHFHHDKHHATYVKTLNELLDQRGATPKSLEDVIAAAATDKDAKLFSNAAQAWNHAFFWLSMAPDRAAPSGDLYGAIAETFGSLDKLKTAFVEEGADHFASGWVWLAAEAGGRKVKILSTHDAEDLVTQPDLTPLLVCDLWEHAYYLDHQNDRKGFLDAWFDALADWGFAGRQLSAARGEGDPWRYPAPE